MLSQSVHAFRLLPLLIQFQILVPSPGEPASQDDRRAEHDVGSACRGMEASDSEEAGDILGAASKQKMQCIALHCMEEEEQTRGALWWVWLGYVGCN